MNLLCVFALNSIIRPFSNLGEDNSFMVLCFVLVFTKDYLASMNDGIFQSSWD